MAVEQELFERNWALDYVFRSLMGLFMGLFAGAAIGACLFILRTGPSDYFEAIHSNRPAGIISGSEGTESSFALAFTYAFAFYGAIGGAILGLSMGLLSATTRRGKAR